MYVGFAIESIFCVEFNSQDFCLRSEAGGIFDLPFVFSYIWGKFHELVQQCEMFG